MMFLFLVDTTTRVREDARPNRHNSFRSVFDSRMTHTHTIEYDFFSAATILLLSLAASSSSAEDYYGSPDDDIPGDGPPPYPLAPPSEEFCRSNDLGSDVYISFFEPCTFQFYEEKPRVVGVPGRDGARFSCHGYNGGDDAIATAERKVLMWPDSCVAAGPRCYSMRDHPGLMTDTVFGDSDYPLDYPVKAAVVSVDCRSDFAKAQEFMKDLPEELTMVSDALLSAGRALIFVGVAFIFMGICCCFGCFRVCLCPDGKARRRQVHYSAIPLVPAVPVATKQEMLV
uniref:Uncharacterized protein n=1 Tax=Odontella aurita TaxID=265563 RepID=A0A7S4JT49_9STRA|mmetsp:Transcript_53484/g.160049  ORF Transcript_53484/g.160049 Transcript_53484/m.160049 type:complete len:285 (+) Transcript_53484:523-1377(+)